MIRAHTKSQTSCPRVLHNRLWRFPFKPPALLGVIGSNVCNSPSRLMTGQGQFTPPSLVAGGDRCSAETGRRGGWSWLRRAGMSFFL
jgi:hypothetical protein